MAKGEQLNMDGACKCNRVKVVIVIITLVLLLVVFTEIFLEIVFECFEGVTGLKITGKIAEYTDPSNITNFAMSFISLLVALGVIPVLVKKRQKKNRRKKQDNNEALQEPKKKTKQPQTNPKNAHSLVLIELARMQKGIKKFKKKQPILTYIVLISGVLIFFHFPARAAEAHVLREILNNSLSELPETQPDLTTENEYFPNKADFTVVVKDGEKSQPRPEGFLAEPWKIVTLTETERARLFYLRGSDFSMPDDCDSVDALYVVIAQISYLRSLEVRDSDVTQDFPDNPSFSLISALQRQEHATQSEDLDASILELEEFYDGYFHFPGVARRQAWSYQWYALEYSYVQGAPSTIISYYAKSIEWALRYVTFGSLNDEDISGMLKYISTRYGDIALVLQPGSSDQLRAILLKEAFKMAAASPDLWNN